MLLKFLFVILCITTVCLNLRAQEVVEGQMNSSSYWFSVVRAQPSNLAYFNLGVALYKEGKNTTAIKAFKKVIASKSPLAPVAKYYYAVVVNKMARPQEARKVISSINIAELPPNLKSDVLTFKNELYADEALEEISNVEEENTKSSFWTTPYGSFDFSYGTNSNPNINPSSVATSGDKDRQTQVKLRTGIDIWQYSLLNWNIEYNFSGTFFQKTSEANYSSHDLTLPFFFRGTQVNLKLYPEFFLDDYSNTRYSQQVGGGADLGIQIDSNYWGLGYQNMSIQNKTTTYSYLTGSQNRTYLYLDHKFESSRLYASLSYSRYAYQDTSTLASSYGSTSLYIAYTYYIGNFDLSASGSIDFKTYNKATSDTTARKDTRTYLDLNASYYYSKILKLYLDINKSVNSSNFSNTSTDYNYDQNIATAGFKFFW